MAFMPSYSYISLTGTPLFYSVKKKNMSLLIFCFISFSCFSFFLSFKRICSFSSIRHTFRSDMASVLFPATMRAERVNNDYSQSSCLSELNGACYTVDLSWFWLDNGFVLLTIYCWLFFPGELFSVRLYLTVPSRSVSQGESNCVGWRMSVPCRLKPRLL